MTPLRLLFLFWSIALFWVEACLGDIQAEEEEEEADKELEATTTTSSSSSSINYGVDFSWPTHHPLMHENPFFSVENRLDEYQEFMSGCRDVYDNKNNHNICDDNERDRISMNVRQPPVQINYTHAGYAKVNIPSTSWQLLKDVWNSHTESTLQQERWDEGSSYVNHWSSPTYQLPLDRLLSTQQRKLLVQQVQEVLQSWTQTTLVPTSLYGIRVYHRNAILAPHVDRLPLVVSAVLNVAQKVDDSTEGDWPLEVIGHDGIAVNVTMQPGEMILYESASVIHGRPFALQGEYYANVFVHFEPVGYTQALEQRLLALDTENNSNKKNDPKTSFERALEKVKKSPSTVKKTKKATSRKLQEVPYYLWANSDEDNSEDDEQNEIQLERWKQDFRFVREYPSSDTASNNKGGASQERVKGVTSAHVVAANGNLRQLQEVEKKNPEALFLADSNGWKPIHEAARAGRTDVVEYLLKKGADINERTNDGNGANAMWWAQHSLPENHPTIVLLRQHGGVPVGPLD